MLTCLLSRSSRRMKTISSSWLSRQVSRDTCDVAIWTTQRFNYTRSVTLQHDRPPPRFAFHFLIKWKSTRLELTIFFAGIFLMNESESDAGEMNSSIKAINIHTGEWPVRPWTSVQWLPGNDFLVWLNRWNPLVSNGCSSSFSSSVSGGSWNWVDDGPRNCSSKDGSMAI